MKIIVTGALGNISLPLTVELIQKGHQVSVISSNPERRAAIEALGATAAIGSIEDVDFLTAAFTGADAAYCMIPMNFKEADQAGYYRRVSNNYVQAIRQAGVLRIINLSGWAAHVVSSENVESIFNELSNIGVTHIRPPYFYTNFYGLKDMIKGKGLMGWLMTLRFSGPIALLTGKRGLIAANFGGEDKIVLVAPTDIAAAVVEELETSLEGTKVRYVASDEMSCNEAARILGTAIGKPYLKWVTLTDKQMQSGLESFGMPPQLVSVIVEMQAAIHSGVVLAEYYRNKPESLGKVKMTDFAKEFAVDFNNS